MNAIEYLEKYKNGKAFARYMTTIGVKEYLYFAELGDDFTPTIADAAMALHESLGKEACQKHGFSCDVSGMVIADGVPIGRGKLAHGKATKDLSIAMWLEDVGQLGFSTARLRAEMDEKLWPGWFDANVSNRITVELLTNNSNRSRAEYRQTRPSRNPWWKTLWIRLIETPSRWRVRRHFARRAKMAKNESNGNH